MTIRQYFSVFRQQWFTVAISVVLFMLLGATIHLLRPKEYTASVAIFVSAPTGDTASSAFEGAQLAERRIKSYVKLVTSPSVLKKATESLGVPESPEDLGAQVSATTDLDSVVMNVAVVDTSATAAANKANAVAGAFVVLAEQLERPTNPLGVAPLTARIVEPSEPPEQPSTTGVVTFLVAGFAVGAFVGLALALLRHAGDVSVRTTTRLRDLTGWQTLGSIPHDSALRSGPIVVHEGSWSATAEGFRQIRSQLQSAERRTKFRTILVTSAETGEGRTFVALNLAAVLTSAGRRVLLVEADLRRPALGRRLGLSQTRGLVGALTDRYQRGQFIEPLSNGLNVLLAGSPTSASGELLASQGMARLVKNFGEDYDVVLVDSPPLLEFADATALALHCDATVLVSGYKNGKERSVVDAVDLLNTMPIVKLGTILSMTPQQHGARTSGGPSPVSPPPRGRDHVGAEVAWRENGLARSPQTGLGAVEDMTTAPQHIRRD